MSDRLKRKIYKEYLALSVKPQDWVRLAKLRPRLGTADRAAVDAALTELVMTGLVHLAPDSNRKVLTEDDHKAALSFGGDPNHLVAFELEYRP